MFGNPVRSGLTFTKVLSGISKVLGVANQAIPIYREAKPMIHNARNAFSVLKEFKTSMNSNQNTNHVKTTSTKKDTIPEAKIISKNNPTFFL